MIFKEIFFFSVNVRVTGFKRLSFYSLEVILLRKTNYINKMFLTRYILYDWHIGYNRIYKYSVAAWIKAERSIAKSRNNVRLQEGSNEDDNWRDYRETEAASVRRV